ncbi:MAG: hypothetical protein QM723_36325 [Myxococcaceae bacterium]
MKKLAASATSTSSWLSSLKYCTRTVGLSRLCSITFAMPFLHQTIADRLRMKSETSSWLVARPVMRTAPPASANSARVTLWGVAVANASSMRTGPERFLRRSERTFSLSCTSFLRMLMLFTSPIAFSSSAMRERMSVICLSRRSPVETRLFHQR